MLDIKAAVGDSEHVLELEAITSMKSEQAQLAEKEKAVKQVMTYLLIKLPNPEECTIFQQIHVEQKRVQELLNNKVEFTINYSLTVSIHIIIDPGNHQSRKRIAEKSQRRGTIFTQPQRFSRATARTTPSIPWCNICWQPCTQVATGIMVIVGIITIITKSSHQDSSREVLCDNIVAVARSKHGHLIGEAEVVKQKFLNIFKRFKKCYDGYSGGSMTQEQINDLGMWK